MAGGGLDSGLGRRDDPAGLPRGATTWTAGAIPFWGHGRRRRVQPGDLLLGGVLLPPTAEVEANYQRMQDEASIEEETFGEVV